MVEDVVVDVDVETPVPVVVAAVFEPELEPPLPPPHPASVTIRISASAAIPCASRAAFAALPATLVFRLPSRQSIAPIASKLANAVNGSSSGVICHGLAAAGEPGESGEPGDTPAAAVATATVNGVIVPPLMATLAGIEHVADCGTPLHCSCTEPDTPRAVESCMLNCAVLPAVMVAAGDAEPDVESTNGFVAPPVRETVCGDPGALSVSRS